MVKHKSSPLLRTVKRHKLLLTVGILVIAVVVLVIFYLPSDGEKMVASGVIQLNDENSDSDYFSYSGVGINQDMALGCSIPASMKIICQSVANDGTITVRINDEAYAHGTITDTGEVMLSSGCGCSTVCICEIKVGENTIIISSEDFRGQVKYEIYVKN